MSLLAGEFLKDVSFFIRYKILTIHTLSVIFEHFQNGIFKPHCTFFTGTVFLFNSGPERGM